jgi:hypothetical protein
MLLSYSLRTFHIMLEYNLQLFHLPLIKLLIIMLNFILQYQVGLQVMLICCLNQLSLNHACHFSCVYHHLSCVYHHHLSYVYHHIFYHLCRLSSRLFCHLFYVYHLFWQQIHKGQFRLICYWNRLRMGQHLLNKI